MPKIKDLVESNRRRKERTAPVVTPSIPNPVTSEPPIFHPVLPPVISPPVVEPNPSLPSRGTFPFTFILNTDFANVAIRGFNVRSRMFPLT